MRRAPGALPDQLARIVSERRDHYDYYEGHLDSQAEHTEYLTDDLITEFAIAGTAAECRARVEELRDLGVSEISSAYLNGEIEQMVHVGNEIIKPLGIAA